MRLHEVRLISRGRGYLRLKSRVSVGVGGGVQSSSGSKILSHLGKSRRVKESLSSLKGPGDHIVLQGSCSSHILPHARWDRRRCFGSGGIGWREQPQVLEAECFLSAPSQ